MNQILSKLQPKDKNKVLLATDDPILIQQFENLFSQPKYTLENIVSKEDLQQTFDVLICEEKFLHIAEHCHKISPKIHYILLSKSQLDLPAHFITLQIPIANKLLKQIVDVVLHHHANASRLTHTLRLLDNQKTMSSHIQHTLIGNPPKELSGCEIAVFREASQEIDSDFLEFYRPLPHIMDVMMGDVMGKGLSSSLIGIATKLQISHFANRQSFPLTYTRFDGWQEEVPQLSFILESTHKALVPLLMDLEHFVSLFYIRFNLRTRQFSYIDCGFTSPIVYRAKTKKAIPLPAYHYPLGVTKNHSYQEKTLFFEEGDFFVFFSDGILTAQSPNGELFGEKRLYDLIEKYADQSPNDIKQLIQNAIKEFFGKQSLNNDLTLLILKFTNLEGYASIANKPAKFNSVISQLHEVRQLIKEYCLKAPGNHALLATELELVVDEAFSNIVKHSYENKPGGSIVIHVEYQNEGLLIELADQGESFNPAGIPHPNLFGDNDTGYGWFLIKHLVDHIIYFPKSEQEGWNRLRLYKKYFNKEAQMELTNAVVDDALVVTLESENLDTGSIPEFKDKVAHLLSSKENANVIFDLRHVKFIDSSGLGAFLSILRQLHMKGGQLKLANLTPPVKNLFELVSMHKIFDCYSSIDEAIQSTKRDGQ